MTIKIHSEIHLHSWLFFLYHVRFKGFSLIIKSSEKLKDYLKVEWSAGFDSKALNQRMVFLWKKTLQIIVFGLAEQRFILDLIIFFREPGAFHDPQPQDPNPLIHHKLQYACRWSSWHYNHHQLKRRQILLGMVKTPPFCLLGEGRALLLMSFAWYLTPTSWE